MKSISSTYGIYLDEKGIVERCTEDCCGDKGIVADIVRDSVSAD